MKSLKSPVCTILGISLGNKKIRCLRLAYTRTLGVAYADKAERERKEKKKSDKIFLLYNNSGVHDTTRRYCSCTVGEQMKYQTFVCIYIFLPSALAI